MTTCAHTHIHTHTYTHTRIHTLTHHRRARCNVTLFLEGNSCRLKVSGSYTFGANLGGDDNEEVLHVNCRGGDGGKGGNGGNGGTGGDGGIKYCYESTQLFQASIIPHSKQSRFVDMYRQ